MVIIEEIIQNTRVPEDSACDEVVMGWQERRQTRQRVRSLGGREFALALATGTVLREGDIVYIGEGFHVAVRAAEEDLLVVPLGDAPPAALAAYELGNRHLPVSIGHDLLATPYDRLVEALFAKLGIAYSRQEGRFEPAMVSHHHG
jgi:urease accessory protein